MNNISKILLGIWLDNQITSEVASIIYKVRADSATLPPPQDLWAMKEESTSLIKVQEAEALPDYIALAVNMMFKYEHSVT